MRTTLSRAETGRTLRTMASLQILLLLCISATVSTDLHKRIYGGQECAKDERLYHVKLLALGSNNQFSMCGGSLINSKWILTAAHCIEGASEMFAFIGLHQGQGKLVRITKKEIYEDGQKRPHDIMLLELPNPVSDIPPGLLPRCDRPPGSVQVAGYASPYATSRGRRLPGESDTLQCADLNVVDCKRIKNSVKFLYPHYFKEMDYQHIFCGYSGKADVCPGDSGGAVVYEGKIYGVIMFTGDLEFVCSQGAGFIDVCKYIDWIHQIVG